jgi:hypothetical protein
LTELSPVGQQQPTTAPKWKGRRIRIYLSQFSTYTAIYQAQLATYMRLDYNQSFMSAKALQVKFTEIRMT